MNIFNKLFSRKGGNNDEVITELTGKVTELEAALSKSALSDSLGYVSGGNYYEYTLNNTDKSYKNNYTVYRGVNMLSSMIAQLPFKLFRGEQELPIDHVFPNGFSMAYPNPSMSLNELLLKSCVYLFFRGEFINHIVDDGIFRLEIINPKNLTRNQDDSWQLNQKNNRIIIQKEQLIYNPLFDPTITNYNTATDRGLSPIDVVRSEIDADSSAGKYIEKFFKNFTQVGGVLVDKEGGATSEDMERVVAQFNSKHQGDSKSYKTVGLPRGVDYKEAAQTMREMQFLDSRSDIRDKILSVLGIHKALMGVTDQVNRSVIEEATRQLWVQTLKPVVIRLTEKFNQQLFRIYFPGYSIKADFSEVKELQENMESILKQAEGYRKLGYTLNEINEHFKLGMELVTDEIGDTRFVPRILTTLDQLTVQTPPKELVAPPKKAIEKIADILIEKETKNTDGDAYRDAYLRKRKPLETKFNSKMKRYFFEQRKDVLKIMSEAKHPHNITNDLGKFFNDEDERIKETTKPLYIEGAELGIKIADAQFKIVNNSIDKDISETLVMNRVNKITGINDTVYNEIKLNLYEGLKAGESTDQIAKRIKGVYNMASTRAKTISRTETGGIINDSTAAEYEKKGVKRISWAGGTRQSHAKVNGTTVSYGEEFANGLKYPGDSSGSGSTAKNLINCRCTFFAVIE